MGKSNIEWTDKVWNPVTGCTKVSEGCRNCYAERMAKRLAGRAGYPEDGFKVTLHPEKLDEPLRWKKPSRIFVCSMGDLFHEAVDIGFLTHVFDMMEQCPQHTFMVLTKRPERIKKMLYEPHGKWRYFGEGKYHPNVYLGVSVEDQKTTDERIPLLLQTPAAKRFVSYEPALGPVDFRRYLPAKWQCSGCGYRYNGPVGSCKGYFHGPSGSCDAMPCPSCGKKHYWTGSMASLDQVIMGGESGPGARPMHPDWARSVRDQCKAAGIPFFFKQWGEWTLIESDEDDFTLKGPDAVVHHNGTFETGRHLTIDLTKGDVLMRRVGKKAAGCLLDGVEHKEMPR